MRRRNWVLATQALASVLLLGALLRGFDWPALGGLVSRLPGSFYLASFATLAFGQLLYAAKWHMMLRAVGVTAPLVLVMTHYFVAMFFNNFLPASVGGDAARIFYLGRRDGFARVGASVVLDRFLGFLGLAVGGALALWLSGVRSPELVAARRVLAVVSLVLGALLLSLVLPVRGVLSRLHVLRRLEALRPMLDERELPPRRVVVITLVVFAIVFSYFLGLALVYRQYFRVTLVGDLPPVALMGILMSIGILTNLPISLNGIGLREQLHFVLFLGLGVPREAAVGVSLIVFAQLLMLSVVGFLLWLRHGRGH